MAKLAFLGLGTMGYPMAGFLAQAGHDITVYNRSPAKAAKWLAEYQPRAKGAVRAAAAPAEAARGQDFVLACVGNDEDVRHITLGEHGAFAAMEKGAVFIDHTTASAALARELGEKARRQGLDFVDAPVSGGQAGAESGSLTIMCGGSEAAFAKIAPIVQAYAVSVRLLGENGAGQLCKMVNQICLVGVVQGLAEGLAFGKRAGLNMETVLEVIGKGSASSRQMENSGAKMLKNEFDYGFAVELVHKDLGMCLAEARRIGAILPVTALIDQFYADLERKGEQRADTTALIKRLE